MDKRVKEYLEKLEMEKERLKNMNVNGMGREEVDEEIKKIVGGFERELNKWRGGK